MTKKLDKKRRENKKARSEKQTLRTLFCTQENNTSPYHTSIETVEREIRWDFEGYAIGHTKKRNNSDTGLLEDVSLVRSTRRGKLIMLDLRRFNPG